MVECKSPRSICNSRDITVIHPFFTTASHSSAGRYLQNGNILAARTFITHLVSLLPTSLHLKSSPISVGSTEVILTSDSLVNFAQLAVLTCQRAQGEKNKAMRESWVRLCGTYQSHGGPLADPDVRRVIYAFLCSLLTCLTTFPGSERDSNAVLCDTTAARPGSKPTGRYAFLFVRWSSTIRCPGEKNAPTSRVGGCWIGLMLLLLV